MCIRDRPYTEEIRQSVEQLLDERYQQYMESEFADDPEERVARAAEGKPAVIPVSYTHLSLPAMRVTAGLRMQSSFWQSGSTLPRPDECEAVSYTHLDVYKRQVSGQ